MPLPRPSALGLISSLVQEVTDRMVVTTTIKINNVFFIASLVFMAFFCFNFLIYSLMGVPLAPTICGLTSSLVQAEKIMEDTTSTRTM